MGNESILMNSSEGFMLSVFCMAENGYIGKHIAGESIDSPFRRLFQFMLPVLYTAGREKGGIYITLFVHGLKWVI